MDSAFFWSGLVLWWVVVNLGYGERMGFVISGVGVEGSSPLVFVGR